MRGNRLIPLLAVIGFLAVLLAVLSKNKTKPGPEGPDGPSGTDCDSLKTPHYCELKRQVESMAGAPFTPKSFSVLLSKLNDFKTSGLIDEGQYGKLRKMANQTYLLVLSNTVSNHCRTASISGLSKSHELKVELGLLEELSKAEQTRRSDLENRLQQLNRAFSLNQEVLGFLRYSRYDPTRTGNYRAEIGRYRTDADFKVNPNIRSVMDEVAANLGAFERWYDGKRERLVPDKLDQFLLTATPRDKTDFFRIKSGVQNQAYQKNP